MTHDIVMPQLGMTMTEGSVVTWLKSQGDSVEKGEPLFIVQTDKVDMEVESPGAGFLTELLVKEEMIVPVGTLIARVSDGMPDGPGLLVSPRARRVAAELGVDLSTIQGTGESGRIREADVRGAITKPDVNRRRIAERMEESVRTIPHFSLRSELDAGRLVALRSELLPLVESRIGVRLSFTDLLLKAMTEGLREVPQMIAGKKISLGFAAQGETRLLVPVIQDMDQLSISQIAQKRAELANKVKEGKISPNDLEGASGTLSNLGAFGVDAFDAIINPPEVFILAAGRIAQRALVVDGQVVARPTLKLTLTVDHRAVDGVLAARFFSAVAKAIEQPLRLLV